MAAASPPSTRTSPKASAAQGHLVAVITESLDINRVDFEHGVWVHRMVVREMPLSAAAIAQRLPQQVWNWSAVALEEARRIASHRAIDAVEAPIWDCEGAAFLFDGRWPLVTSLQTTLHFWLDSHPHLRADMAWMDSFGAPMLAMEKKLMRESNAMRSISAAIKRDIEQAYGFTFKEGTVRVAPLGMAGLGPAPAQRRGADARDVLFVGRLEQRKGIDTLLAAIPQVLAGQSARRVPHRRRRHAADAGQKASYKEAWLASAAGAAHAARVHFSGRVGQQQLSDAYAGCDIFVAPSRFESFGLVFLEAMREGKPVIGCLAGGMPEVVEHEVNGLLVPPADAAALAAAILRLAGAAPLRAAMGAAGRRIFTEKFTAERMAEASIGLYQLATANLSASHP